MSNEILRVENLSKEYRLGVIGYGTLREDLQSWWARARGKEDPNERIFNRKTADPKDKHFLALDDISFTVNRGDRVGIIGKNGAGKSTLLKILSRLTSPTRGRVFMRGHVSSLLEVGTGFHPELTGRENIYLNGSILGMKKREIDKKIDEIIDFSGVEKFVDTPVKRYSSGMRVRLGFAVAANLEPDILIVDEVLAVGDAEFQKKAIGKMEEVSNDFGRTILFVSHNMESVRRLCDRGIILENGSILEDDFDITKVVSKYLNFDMNNSSLNSWEGSGFNNDWFEINRFSLVDADMNLRNQGYQNDEEIYIVIDVDIKKEPGEIRFGVALVDENGNRIFRSYTTDTDKDDWTKLKIGKNIIIMQLPGGLLNKRRYKILMLYSVLGQGVISTVYTKAPSIILFISSTYKNTPIWVERKEDILVPILKWSLK